MVGVRRGAVRSPPRLSISLWGTRYLEHQCTSILSQTETLKVMLVGWWLPLCIPELHPQNGHHFAWHPSGRISQIFQSIYFSHWLQVLCTQIWAYPPLWLQKHTDLYAHNFVHSPNSWHHPRLINVTCTRSWRLCGITPAISSISIKIVLFW